MASLNSAGEVRTKHPCLQGCRSPGPGCLESVIVIPPCSVNGDARGAVVPGSATEPLHAIRNNYSRIYRALGKSVNLHGFRKPGQRADVSSTAEAS